MTADERRERYAASIFGSDGEYPWGDLRREDQWAYFPYADAAMAVADDEIQGGIDVMRRKLDRERDENNRLRRELEATQRAKRENDERFQLDAAEARAEADRLRARVAELEADRDAAVAAAVRRALEDAANAASVNVHASAAESVRRWLLRLAEYAAVASPARA